MRVIITSDALKSPSFPYAAGDTVNVNDSLANHWIRLGVAKAGDTDGLAADNPAQKRTADTPRSKSTSKGGRRSGRQPDQLADPVSKAVCGEVSEQGAPDADVGTDA